MNTMANVIKGVAIIGRPGAGKSTIAKLVEKWNPTSFVYIGAGDAARELAKHDAETDRCLKAGLMAPEHKMLRAMDEALQRAVASGKMFVTDGFPRSIEQLQWLQQKYLTMLVLIDVDEEECYQRLMARQRYDDTQEIVMNRMKFYDANTSRITDRVHLIYTNYPNVEANGTIAEDIVHRATSLRRVGYAVPKIH